MKFNTSNFDPIFGILSNTEFKEFYFDLEGINNYEMENTQLNCIYLKVDNIIGNSGRTTATSSEDQIKSNKYNNNMNKITKVNKINNYIPKQEKVKQNHPRIITLSEIIKNYISKMTLPKEVINKIMINSIIFEKGEKRKLNENTQETKRGRKTKGDNSERVHDKNSSENIIKKAKGSLFRNALYCINLIIISNGNNKNILKQLDYKIINKMKKKFNLKLLKTKLKDIFSNDISLRDKKLSKDYNKIKIKEIYEKEGDDSLIKNVLDLTLEQWYKYFTYQEEYDFLNNFEKDYNNQIELNEDDLQNNNKIKRIDDLLSEISNKEDNFYFSKFIFHFYNYKHWFYIKKGRNEIEDEEEDKMEEGEK